MNKLSKLFNKKAILLDFETSSKKDALKKIAEHLFQEKFINNVKMFNKALLKREKEFSTGIGKGIAIPHAQNESVIKNVVLFAKCKNKINWKASDGDPIDIIFTICLNDEDSKDQVEILQELSRFMMNEEKMNKIKQITKEDEIIKFISK